jgi:hypothetical protein
MMNKVVTVLVAGALALAPALYGQEDDKKQGQKQQADRASEQTLTGCLTEEQGAFKLSTQAGEKIDVSGADLMKHKNHTVKLTGATSSEGGKTTMNVSKIDHVSGSCAK